MKLMEVADFVLNSKMPFLDRLFPDSLFSGLDTAVFYETFIVDQLLPDIPSELNAPLRRSAMRTGQQNIPPTAESQK